VFLDGTTLATPALSMLGVASTPAIVTNSAQTVRIAGPSGGAVRLLQTEGALFLGGVPNDGFDIDAFESNKVILVQHSTVTIGASGFADVAVVLSDSHERGGVTTFVAVLQDLTGRTSPLSNFVTVALHDDPATGETADVTGLLSGDYDGSGAVDSLDYSVWQRSFAELGDGMFADGNADGAINTADYVVWRKSLGSTIPGHGASVAIAAAGSALVPDQPGIDDFAHDVALESVSASFVSGAFDGRPERNAMPNHRDLASRSRISVAIAARALDVDLLMLDAKQIRSAANEVDTALAESNSHELEFAEPELRELEWGLALESLRLDTRFQSTER
jgi:hypothetical protein